MAAYLRVWLWSLNRVLQIEELNMVNGGKSTSEFF
jgi:hypothetical protein